MRHPIVITKNREFWNINQISIVYALRRRLRDRLTLSGLTFLRKPESFGVKGSHLHYRYLCRQGLFSNVHVSSQLRFIHERMLSYHAHQRCAFAASVYSFSPVVLSAPDRLTSELLRFL